MKADKKKKLILLCVLCVFFVALFSLAGCLFASSLTGQTGDDTWADSGFVKIGHDLTVSNTDNLLTLSDSKDVLSATGLYYAAWTIGESIPYVNSDGESVSLYDAQLYCILSEHKSTEEADKDLTKWMDLSRQNYEVVAQEEVVCNGQTYVLLTYNCISETNPYDRGISAFGLHGNDAICFELTCLENFDRDLKDILISFLNQCTYRDN